MPHALPPPPSTYFAQAMKFFKEEYPALGLQPDARTYQALVKMVRCPSHHRVRVCSPH